MNLTVEWTFHSNSNCATLLSPNPELQSKQMSRITRESLREKSVVEKATLLQRRIVAALFEAKHERLNIVQSVTFCEHGIYITKSGRWSYVGPLIEQTLGQVVSSLSIKRNFEWASR